MGQLKMFHHKFRFNTNKRQSVLLLIIGTAFFVIIFVTLMFLQYLVKNTGKAVYETNSTKSNMINYYFIPRISDVKNVTWKDNQTLLLIDTDNLYKYLAISRDLSIILQVKENSVVGSNDTGKILLCEWENFEKNEPKDDGTLLKVSEISNNGENVFTQTELKKLRVKETIALENCSDKEVSAHNAYSFMEEKSYIIDILGEKVKGQDQKQNTFTIDNETIEKIVIHKNGIVFREIERQNDVFQIAVSPDETKIALITVDGEVVISY